MLFIFLENYKIYNVDTMEKMEKNGSPEKDFS